MAKTQNLSLNPTKISGTCGRLMCCLKYEQEAYEDLLRNAPKLDSFVDTPEGRGTVVEIDLLRSRVKVRMEDAPETVSVFPNAEIAVLRSGKAKKNDPPIPADLAPISGSGKRVRKEPEAEPVLLDPIRFRYSTEKIVEEAEEPEAPAAEPIAQEPAAEPAAKSSRSRRRRKNKDGDEPRTVDKQEQPKKSEEAPAKQTGHRKPQADKPKKQPKKNDTEAKAEPKAEPAAETAGEEQVKKPRRRPPYRRRKPKTGASEGNNG